MEIPALLADITPGWLGGALGIDVDDVAVDQIGKGEGFTGQVARLAISYGEATELPGSMIVKLPTDNEDQIWIGQAHGVWEKEHRFYENAAQHVTERIPACYLNLGDNDETRYVLLLEDLAPMTTADQIDGATPDQARACVSVLGQLHGRWYGDSRLQEWTWLGQAYNPALDLLPDLFEMSWAMATERYADRVPTKAFEMTKAFSGQAFDWYKHHYCTMPSTLNHGDFRLDNLLFDDQGEIAVIDWQTVSPNPGATDLFFFILLNLSVEARRELEEELLDLYLQSLGPFAAAQAGFTPDELRRIYREAMLFYCMTMTAGIVHLDPANERGTRLVDVLVERTVSAVDDHKSWEAHGLG